LSQLLQKLLGVENQMDLATTYSVNENQADTPKSL